MNPNDPPDPDQPGPEQPTPDRAGPEPGGDSESHGASAPESSGADVPGSSESLDAEERAARYVEEFLALFEHEERPDVELFCAQVPEKLRATVRERCIDIGFIQKVFKTRAASDPSPLERSDMSTGRELGDFRMLRELGRGAMGVVYLARQISLDRLVAVKVLLPHLSLSERQVERFRREALSAAKLQHPGIVPIYAVGKAEGMHFFAMEFVPGRSLAVELESLRVRRREQRAATATERLDATPGRSYPAEVAEIGALLAEALHFAHQRGIIHRDVKPQNVLLGEDLAPHIVDFGLAKDLEELSLSRSGEIAGTPYYMSPEQALAKRVKIDHRTDVYSLGVVLYEMLTLRRPFEGKTSNEVLFEITFKEPPAIRTLNKRVPRDLETIVVKAMEKSPERRYADAAEMAADLRRFLGHESIFARPPSWLEIGRRKLVRHRTVAITTVVSVAALGIGLQIANVVLARRSLQERMARIAVLERTPDLQTIHPNELREIAGVARGLSKESAELSGEDRALLARASKRVEEFGLGLKQRGIELRDRALQDTTPLPASFAGLHRSVSTVDYWRVGQALEVLQRAAALLPDDQELARLCDPRTSLPTLSVDTGAEGDRVSVMEAPTLGTDFGPKQDLGATPLVDVSVAPGLYRVVVERPGFGFAECMRYLDLPGRHYSIRLEIRPTSEVTARAMVLVPAGTFSYGDPRSTAPDSTRARDVSLSDYWIDTYEVSNREYREFVQAMHWPEPLSWKWGYDSAKLDPLPVVGVEWLDAIAYAEWRGKRLATREEWSRAARGSKSFEFPWSNDPAEAKDRAVNGKPLYPSEPQKAWFDSYLDGVRPVASMPEGKSPEGLFHTYDNVDEWTESMAVSVVEDSILPQPGVHVIAGGCWIDTPETFRLYDVRWTNINNGPPAYTGIRCAKSARP